MSLFFSFKYHTIVLMFFSNSLTNLFADAEQVSVLGVLQISFQIPFLKVCRILGGGSNK